MATGGDGITTTQADLQWLTSSEQAALPVWLDAVMALDPGALEGGLIAPRRADFETATARSGHRMIDPQETTSRCGYKLDAQTDELHVLMKDLTCKKVIGEELPTVAVRQVYVIHRCCSG